MTYSENPSTQTSPPSILSPILTSNSYAVVQLFLQFCQVGSHQHLDGWKISHTKMGGRYLLIAQYWHYVSILEECQNFFNLIIVNSLLHFLVIISYSILTIIIIILIVNDSSTLSLEPSKNKYWLSSMNWCSVLLRIVNVGDRHHSVCFKLSKQLRVRLS